MSRSDVDSSYDSPSTPGLPLGLRVAVDEGVIDSIHFEKDLPIFLSRRQDTRSPSEAHYNSFRASDDGKGLDDSQTSEESAQTTAENQADPKIKRIDKTP
jgi:hypothetical protein